jgi:RNA polymerase sigma-70 factor (ECF subfamily)
MKTIHDDATLLALLKREDSREKGFRLLMGQYQEKLYWHIRRMVNDHDDTNDLLQNTFVKVFRNLDGFEGKSGLYTWLYRIATNETLTFLDAAKRRATSSIQQENTGLENQLRADAPTDGEDIQIRLKKAIDTLPEKQKLVFHMRYYDEMPYEEMSEVLQTSVGALKASFHHAAKKVESHLLGTQTFD